MICNVEKYIYDTFNANENNHKGDLTGFYPKRVDIYPSHIKILNKQNENTKEALITFVLPGVEYNFGDLLNNISIGNMIEKTFLYAAYFYVDNEYITTIYGDDLQKNIFDEYPLPFINIPFLLGLMLKNKLHVVLHMNENACPKINLRADYSWLVPPRRITLKNREINGPYKFMTYYGDMGNASYHKDNIMITLYKTTIDINWLGWV